MATTKDYLDSLIRDRDNIVAKLKSYNVDIADNAKFTIIPDKIDLVPVEFTKDATATAGDMLSSATAYANGVKITGTIATYDGATTVEPGQTEVILYTNGDYLSSNITVSGVSNLLAENIKLGEVVGGVTGTYSGSSYETYEGSYDITPGPIGIVYPTKDKLMSNDLTIEGDKFLIEGNVKKGVTIFGVTGTYEGTVYAKYTGPYEITPSNLTLHYETKNYLMTDNLTINGDENLVADNIKKDTTIFGITGTYEGTTYPEYGGAYDVQPSTAKQTLETKDMLMKNNVTVNGDENLITDNIKAGVSIFGVAGKSTVVDTYTADNASSSEVREGSVAFVNGQQITGTAKELSTKTYTVSTEDQAINAEPTKNSYIILKGNSLVVKGEPNLLAENIAKDVTIGNITGTLTGADFSKVTAIPANVLSGKDYYDENGDLVEGTMQEYTGEVEVMPTTSDVVLATANSYIKDNITITGDEDLAADNIKLGTTIFGVEGTYTGSSYETYTGDTTWDSTNVDFSTSDTFTFDTKDKIVGDNIELDKDSNLIAENIKKDVVIYGVTGTYDGGSKGNINFLDCSSMSSAAEVVTAYSDLYSVKQGTATDFSPLATYDYSSCPIGGAYVQNLAGVEFHNGTGILLYNEKITVESTQLIMKLVYYVSTWINPTISVNLITADDLDEAKTKAIAGEYAATRSVTLSNTFNKQSVFYEFDSILEIGEYYICLSFASKAGGNEGILNYAEMIQL